MEVIGIFLFVFVVVAAACVYRSKQLAKTNDTVDHTKGGIGGGSKPIEQTQKNQD